MDYDLKALTPAVTLITPVSTSTAATNGTGQDFQNYQGKLLVSLAAALCTEVSATLNVKIQDSPNNANWTDVTNGAFTQLNNNTASVQQIAIDTRATNRYLRAIGTIGGNNTPTYAYGVFANGFLKYNPDGVNTAT